MGYLVCFLVIVLLKKKKIKPSPGWWLWVEHQPADQSVAGSIPSQGTCLGCGLGPWWGTKRPPHIDADVSLPLFLPSSLSKKDKIFKKISK